MQLSLNRYFSDRLVFNDDHHSKLHITNSLCDWIQRIIAWIYSPPSYTEENRKTIRCFNKYLIAQLGVERLQRICTRYSLNFEKMEKEGSPLLSRHVAQIVIGAKNVSVQDIPNFQSLSGAELDSAIQKAQDPFGGIWEVAPLSSHISGRPTELFARIFYDPFLADRERIQLCQAHPAIKKFKTFLHHMSSLVIKREMDVGTLVSAPNRSDGVKQYYLIRGKLVTGEGMVSYILDPATQDTELPSVRLFRGTAARNSEVDGISSVITDLERRLGESAYQSGLPYEPYIANKPSIEAGHSLGGSLVQWRAANMDHIGEIYCFASPGIPVEEVAKFNKKNRSLHLVIRQVEGDRPSRVGGAHLGWQYEGNVDLKIKKPRWKLHYDPHVAVFGVEPIDYTVNTITSTKERDRRLYSKGNLIEKFRSLFGPPAAFFLKGVRKIGRKVHVARADLEKGLKLGSFKNGQWQVERFGPFPYNPKA